jgi:DNA-binding LacI/PurR family transcriptional regulator
MSAFKVTSPVEQFTAELRKRIHQGAWEGRLPGLLQLGEQFGASRRTVIAGIAELIRTGDLKSTGPRRAPVPVRRLDAKQAQGTLLVKAPNPEYEEGTYARDLSTLLQSRLPQPVHTLDQKYLSQPTEVLVSRVLATGWRSVVVCGHPGEVSDRLVEAGLNVVSLGGNRPQKSFYIFTDVREYICAAFRNAFALGHRTVCHPIWREGPDRTAFYRECIAEEYARAGLRYAPDFHTPIVEGPVTALHECLRALLRHTPPTALITSGTHAFLATFGVAAELGIRIPRDLSHIALYQDDLWEALPVSQAHLAFLPPIKVVTAVIKLLEAAKQGKPREVVALPMVWVPGDTLAPPRKG